MKTKQEKIIVPSIGFYDMAIRTLTSSIAKRKQHINTDTAVFEACRDVLKNWSNCYDEILSSYKKTSIHECMQQSLLEQKQEYISARVGAKKAIKNLSEAQRIEKKMLAHYIQLKRELTDGVKACNNFVEESCNTQ